MSAPCTSAFALNEKELRQVKQEIIQEILQSQNPKQKIREKIKSVEHEKRFIIVKKQEQKNKAILSRIQNQLRPVDPDRDRIFGNILASVSIIEYSDFECPYCRKIHPILKHLVNRSDGKVNWVFRHFPLAIHEPNASQEAEASECAGSQRGHESFWKFTDSLFIQTRRGKQHREPLIKKAAETAGIKYEELQECLKANTFITKIKNDEKEALSLGLKGTPANILINQKTGKIFFRQGSATLKTLQNDIEKLLEIGD